MSMSLAPSPTATVWASGTPNSAGEPAQRRRLAGPVDDRPDQPSGEQAVGDLELVGRREVEAEIVDEIGR